MNAKLIIDLGVTGDGFLGCNQVHRLILVYRQFHHRGMADGMDHGPIANKRIFDMQYSTYNKC